jgi:flagellar hook-basal body complex protein FliE
MSTPTAAANAYASLARITDAASALARLARPDAALGKSGGEGGPSFNTLLTDALGSVTKAGQTSDAQIQSLAGGKANIVDVVTAVSETEVAVEALVAVRDKMIQAYEEIMRMPI